MSNSLTLPHSNAMKYRRVRSNDQYKQHLLIYQCMHVFSVDGKENRMKKKSQESTSRLAVGNFVHEEIRTTPNNETKTETETEIARAAY